MQRRDGSGAAWGERMVTPLLRVLSPVTGRGVACAAILFLGMQALLVLGYAVWLITGAGWVAATESVGSLDLRFLAWGAMAVTIALMAVRRLLHPTMDEGLLLQALLIFSLMNGVMTLSGHWDRMTGATADVLTRTFFIALLMTAVPIPVAILQTWRWRPEVREEGQVSILLSYAGPETRKPWLIALMLCVWLVSLGVAHVAEWVMYGREHNGPAELRSPQIWARPAGYLLMAAGVVLWNLPGRAVWLVLIGAGVGIGGDLLSLLWTAHQTSETLGVSVVRSLAWSVTSTHLYWILAQLSQAWVTYLFVRPWVIEGGAERPLLAGGEKTDPVPWTASHS